MRTIKYFAILLLGMLSVFVSCRKEEPYVNRLTDIHECYNNKSWDSLKIRDSLIGIWDWEYITCAWVLKPNGEDFNGLSIEFKSNNTLEVKEKGKAPFTSDWKVVKTDFEFFQLEVDPKGSQSAGYLFVCKDEVVFNNSYRDGCDNFFRKRK